MSDKEKNGESFFQKAILVILGGLIGASITGIANFFLQKDNQSATLKLARDKFQSDLIIQSLNSPNFSQALSNLNFIIDANLIDDPGGKIKDAAVKYQPQIQSPDSPRLETASSLERKGFQALLSRNLEEAQKLFESAYNTYSDYHMVDEISHKLLKGKTSVSDWGKEIYCPIVDQYSWGMPEDQKKQMITKGNCSPK
jgi:hypothetical protein